MILTIPTISMLAFGSVSHCCVSDKMYSTATVVINLIFALAGNVQAGTI